MDRLQGVNQFNVLIIPGSPALVPELAPRDDAGRKLVSAIRALIENDARPIHIVGSRDSRWYTQHTGSFAAWGAPQVNVGRGNYVAELVARYCFGPAVARVTDSRGTLKPFDPEVLTIVVLDGSAGLTQRAPLALIEGAEATHEQMARFLDGKATLPKDLAKHGVIEPALWEELAAQPAKNEQLIVADASLGVGRFVATWEVAHG
ncbi:hypothetical protein CJ203_07090 [Corynebacterium tuscaniense]|uniref:Uncharacterized protein n=1 Tax=Corynebacterium tuscaniense TaxID=302449 RepID=A0A2N6T4A9_9CORY|nr:hypothetical protein HMPREF2129_00225 [Corynebacterium tuscaniense DNF00037]PMC64159.1 hypothetical protein CJ203_07090 [Corynebacterium tuscaniense]